MTAFIIFIITLIVLVALFIIKYVESKKGHLIFASNYRSKIDEKIIKIENDFKYKCTVDNILKLTNHLYNSITHKFAKVTAGIAKKIEWRARNVAHKSAKAKQNGESVRENEYLKDVQEHKSSLDTSKVAQETKL